MAIIPNDPDDFREWYPRFDKRTDEEITTAYYDASFYVDNTAASPIPYDPDRNVLIRKIIFYKVMCHVLELAGRSQYIVGTVSGVTEGSVTVGINGLSYPGTASWWGTTPCGASAYQMLLAYTSGGYLANGCFR